jgi:hypothetical protein
MNSKIALGGAIVIAVVAASIIRHHSPSTSSPIATNDQTPDAVSSPEITPEPTVAPPPATRPQKLPPAAVMLLTTRPVFREMPKPIAQTVIAPIQRPLLTGAPPLHPAVPIGRAALSFVGMDPGAELIWGLTINDPSVPPEERKNLIEDLNEDGFPDPKHVTADDVPLILNRMALIEQMAPDSMDETNAAAFMEAYKDLLNMLAKAAN